MNMFYAVLLLSLLVGRANAQTLALDTSAKTQWNTALDTTSNNDTLTKTRSAWDILTSTVNDTDNHYVGPRFTTGPNYIVKLTLANGQSVTTGSTVDILDLAKAPVNVLFPFDLVTTKYYHAFMIDLDSWSYDSSNGYSFTAYWITPNLSPYQGITSCTGTYNVAYAAPDFAAWEPGDTHRIAVVILSSTSALTKAPTNAAANPAGYTIYVFTSTGAAQGAVTMKDGSSFNDYVEAGIFVKVQKPTAVTTQFTQASVWETTKWATANPPVPSSFNAITNIEYGTSGLNITVTQSGKPLDITTDDFTKFSFTYGASASAGTLYTVALTMLDDDTASNVEVLDLLLVNQDGKTLQTALAASDITSASGNNLVAYTKPAAATAKKYYRCVLWIFKQSGSLSVTDTNVKAPSSTNGWSVAKYAKDNSLTLDAGFMFYVYKTK